MSLPVAYVNHGAIIEKVSTQPNVFHVVDVCDVLEWSTK